MNIIEELGHLRASVASIAGAIDNLQCTIQKGDCGQSPYLPCPGCGSESIFPKNYDTGPLFMDIFCDECGWRGPRAEEIVAATDAWNRRAPVTQEGSHAPV